MAFSLSSRRILAGLGLVTLAAIALRLWRIDAAGYWSDELFSIFWVRQGLDVLWGVGLHVETTPPLYYTLLKPWTAAFGETELAGRGFSALFSALAVPLTYRLARNSPRPARRCWPPRCSPCRRCNCSMRRRRGPMPCCRRSMRWRCSGWYGSAGRAAPARWRSTASWRCCWSIPMRPPPSPWRR
ncbi:hypothetical protein ACFQU2_23865 [Siccirubricoccus deserti]